MSKLPPWIAKTKPSSKGWSGNGFYQSSQWIKLRQAQLTNNPLCATCEAKGVTTPANIADHIIPISNGGAALDINNLQSLCTKCHNTKSAIERWERKAK